MLIPQTKNIGLPLMNLMRFKGLPILQQLHIEEQLLRTSSENWCIVNDGTNDPTVVMGVLGRSGSCHKKGEVLLLLTMGRYLSLSYAIKKQFLTYNHILDQSCLGAAHYTAKSFKELVISIFVKMIMYSVTTSSVEMLNPLPRIGGSTTLHFYGTSMSRTCLT